VVAERLCPDPETMALALAVTAEPTYLEPT
jgi:hypothetical protein